MTVPRGTIRTSIVLIILISGSALLSAQTPAQPQSGRKRVLVQLRAADASGARVMRGLGNQARIARRFAALPFIALEVTPEARAALAASPDVARVFDDEIVHPVLAQSVPLIEGDQAWAAGYDGSGTISIVWLGRRQIVGIEPGRQLIAWGRVSLDHDRPVIFNPRYELRPVGAE